MNRDAEVAGAYSNLHYFFQFGCCFPLLVHAPALFVDVGFSGRRHPGRFALPSTVTPGAGRTGAATGARVLAFPGLVQVDFAHPAAA